MTQFLICSLLHNWSGSIRKSLLVILKAARIKDKCLIHSIAKHRIIQNVDYLQRYWISFIQSFCIMSNYTRAYIWILRIRWHTSWFQIKPPWWPDSSRDEGKRLWFESSNLASHINNTFFYSTSPYANKSVENFFISISMMRRSHRKR